AAKCNFCSHRVDEGLLPACVVVCPEEALLFGDLDDPTSKVRRALGENATAVRRPEQGTRPQAYYIGAHSATLDPLAARHDATFMWADRGPDDVRDLVPLARRSTTRAPARVAYDVPRQRTWRWPVSSYIWTKGIAAGLGVLAGLSRVIDVGATRATQIVAPLAALVFLGLTGALLVGDLKRPERFWTILTRPQWKSWLARGAFIISAYGLTLAIWLALALTGRTSALNVVAPILVLLGALTAAYTAWLFAQCEARDLWQSRFLLPHLLLHALGAGAAVLIVIIALSGAPLAPLLRDVFIACVVTTGAIALADGLGHHRTANATAAAHALTRGSQSRAFWLAMVIGLVLPLAVISVSPALSAVLSLAGWWLHGHAFVLAGQGPPIS
ncbi:MAG TPA: NrfD/PsrC family molybdoenzyme membrane anchor subunit, partial [Gemmatimonadaceae bacterium]|nr:NrfD/PsrC family molybdoenzyme membrane anchor subunit [Gemmatimonadaceae bacterium]